MIENNNQMEEPVEVIFPNRNKATLVMAPPDVEAKKILEVLDLKQPEALILVTGTRGEIDRDLNLRLQQLFSRGIARAAVKKDALLMDCGLHGGVMELLGQGVADRERKVSLLGVAPKKMVTYPGGPDIGHSSETVALDHNHSHFVLVEHDEWEEATKMMFGLGVAVTIAKCHDTSPIQQNMENGQRAKPEPNGLNQERLEEDSFIEESSPELPPAGETESVESTAEGMEDDVPVDSALPESDVMVGESEMSAGTIAEPMNETVETNRSNIGERPDDELISEESEKLKLALCKIPAVAILAGSRKDTLAKKEILYSVRQGWPVIILQGTGELPDEIFEYYDARKTALTKIRIETRRRDGRSPMNPRLPYIPDPDIAEIVIDGKLVFVPPEADAEELQETIIQSLPDPWAEDVLIQAWERFATFDKNAGRHQREFHALTTRILTLGFLTTLTAVLLTWVTTSGPPLESVALQILRWTVIALPILTSIAISIFNRRKSDNKWLLLRGGAESLKRRIYAYRALAPYEPRKQLMELEQEVENVSQRLMRTEVNESALLKYEGPIPPKMYGAAATDDGLSPLEPDRYMKIRIGDQVTFYESRTNQKEETLRFYQLAILVIGGLGTFLAAIGGELWVPLTTAAVTAITTYLLSEQFQETIVRYNQNKTDLQNVEIWWRALSPTDKEKPDNIKRLVNTTEELMIQEVRGWVQNMQDALSELRKDFEDSEQQT